MLDIKELIKKILVSFEQSSTTIKYSKIYEWEDGPNKIKQITVSFGITEYGNLKKLIQNYCLNKGMFTEQFLPFIPILPHIIYSCTYPSCPVFYLIPHHDFIQPPLIDPFIVF